MIRTLMRTAVMLLLALTCAHGDAAAQSRAATRMAAMGARGFNLANWLEAGWLGGAYPNPTEYTRADLEALARMGFRAIRVPVIFEWVISEVPPYATITNPAPFAIIDSVILPVAEKYNMAVIIDNHHGRDLTDATADTARARLCGMWRFLAEKYRALSHERVFFELRNEPTYEISNENLHGVQQAVIDTIRKYDADRTLIVGANWWNAGGSLTESEPYRDAQDNIIYTFHNYDPFAFTHQGFSWSGLPLGPTFAYPSGDADAIFALFGDVRAWADTHAVPVFLGEFGASWYADPASRCAYIQCLADACDSMRLPWMYWDVKHADDAFGIFRGGVVRSDSLIACFRDAMRLGPGTAAPAAPRVATPALRVWPNPASDRIWIARDEATEQATLSIVNAAGISVLELHDVGHYATTSVTTVAPGQYWVISEGIRGRHATAFTVRR